MIRLENITKEYNSCIALRGVDLTIEDGSFNALVGTSGSGKSTLLNIIGGMDSVTAGNYYFNDELVSEYSFSKLHKFRK